MTETIPEPLPGADVIAWARPVTRSLNALRDKVGAHARNERNRRPAQQPQPFEVRWDNSLNSGSGGYKIYLPSGHLLSYEDEDIETSDISGATVIQSDNADTPWYSLDDIDTSADHVWLVVTVSDPESEGNSPTVEAEFSSSEGQLQTGENVINVCIAEIDYTEPEDEGSAPTVKISQSVVGAIRLSPSGQEPDDVSIEKIPDSESGGAPSGDEGKLQLKGFKSGTPADSNTLADYLQGNAAIPSEGIALVARLAGSSMPSVLYIPLTAFSGDSEDEGKTIADVEVVPSSSETVVTFTYTDETTTEIHIPHGLPGSPGAPGQDGDTPEITAEKNGGVTHIFADGDLIATIMDGETPTITADKVGGVTTIYANGVAIAQINDGTGSGSLPDKNVVDDVSFSISGGKLKATLAKSNLKTGATSEVTKDICDVSELDVVVSEEYSTSTHKFTNARKSITVIGTPSDAQGQEPFTATPHSQIT